MLQVTFRNLLPSEELMDTANETYLALRERMSAGGGLRCYVTVSTVGASAARDAWVRVHVELVRDKAAALRVQTEGVDPQRVVRSAMLAAAPARNAAPIRLALMPPRVLPELTQGAW